MVKNTKKPFYKNKLLIIAAIAVGALGLVGGWLYVQSQVPHPIGDKLEYIGKRDYGCAWLCDSPPSTTYSYATDMTPPELAEYFQNANATEPQFQISRWENRGETFHIDFTNKDSGETFTIYFYTKPSEQETYTDTELTKKYIISLSSNYYRAAVDSLQ